MTPEVGLGELAAVLALPVGQVLAAARRAASDRRRASWELALLLTRIDDERLYAPRYRSPTAWGLAELGMRSSSLSKHLQAGRLLLGLPPERQRAVMQVGPSTAYETGLLRLARCAPARAAALATARPTQRALRQAVARVAPTRPTPLHVPPAGVRWALAVLRTTSGVSLRLEVTDQHGRAASARTLTTEELAEELLRLAEATGARPALEMALRAVRGGRRAA